MNKILLDTNAYSRLILGDQQVLEALAQAESVYVSVFVMAELLAGFKGGAREKENRRLFDAFMTRDSVLLLSATARTAEIFSDIKQRLKTAGTPIPIHDVWIAAHALETGSFLVTYDKHFNAVAGLLLWAP